MRLARWIAVLVLVLPSLARADMTSRVLAAGDGAGSTANAPATDMLAWAGEPDQITLPELLKIAVQQSPDLRTAKLDIEIAEARIAQTRVRNDWLLEAQIQGSRSTASFGGIPFEATTFNGTVDVSRALPTGGRIGLHVGTEYNKSTSAMLGESKYWEDTASINVTHPLLRGRGTDLWDATERQAVLGRDIAVLGRRLAAIQAVQAVIAAYWDLVLAERQIAITEASLALARERLRVTDIGAKGGKIAEAEIPAVQQIIATREEELLGQQLVVIDRSITLRRAVGMTVGAGDLGLRVATDFETQDKGWELAPLLERAYQASPELAQLAKQTQGNRIDIEVNENNLLPRLDAALSFGPSSRGDTFLDAIKFDEPLWNVAGSLSFQQSLQRSDIKGRARELHAVRQKIAVTEFDVRAQIAQTMARAVAQIELAKRRVVLSQRAIELAKENIRIETDRFSLGKATNFDVLNRQEELRQAELREAQARIDWHKAETVVQALTTDLLPAFGVTVE